MQGPNSWLVVARVVVIEGTGDGLFVYDGPAALGNLVDSVAAVSGTDLYGNIVEAGITTYNPSAGIYAQLYNAALQFGFTTLGGTPAGISGLPGGITLGSGSDGGLPASLSVNAAGPGPFPNFAAVQVNANASLVFNGNTESLFAFLTPSGDTSGLDDSTNIADCFSAGVSVVWLLPGTWYVYANIVTLTYAQQIIMPPGAIVNGVGSGIVFAQTWNGTFSANTVNGGGITGGGMIDISSMGAGSTGVQVGDIHSVTYDIGIRDTTVRTTPLTGFSVLNQYHWTENGFFKIRCYGCTITHNVTGSGTASFKGTFADYYIEQGEAAYDMLQFLNSAHMYDSFCKYTANATGTDAAAVTSCAIRLDAQLSNSVLQWGPECGSGFTFTPQSIIFGTGAAIVACSGEMNFNQNFTASNYSGGGSFFGPVQGDATLLPLVNLDQPIGFRAGLWLGGGGNVVVANNQTISTAGITTQHVTSAGNVTGIILQPGTYNDQVFVLMCDNGVSTLTMAAAGSNTNFGSGTINPENGYMFVWSAPKSLWYLVN
jgi:hypothetical protein